MSRNDWIIILIALIAYQFYATFVVMKSERFDDHQKLRMVVVVWLIPVVGAVLVRMRVQRAERELPPGNRPHGGE